MIKVLKFGGASIKDVDSIKNVVSIIQSFKNQKLVVVFSAIANVTNMLEKVVDEFVKQDSNPLVTLSQIKERTNLELAVGEMKILSGEILQIQFLDGVAISNDFKILSSSKILSNERRYDCESTL